MAKLVAVLNVVAWAGFWAFGYLALTADGQGGDMVTAELLAALGAGLGLWAWFWIVRHAEATGYAPRVRRARPVEDEDAGALR